MQFLYPSFLWALLALAIPIIIHLFHFRRFKKVYFTNVDLLKEIKEETSTRSRLKNLLVLLSRLAALALLVFAFAQPIIGYRDADAVSAKSVGLVIDNSYSMEAAQDDVQLIVRAKDRAKEIINAHGEDDRFYILTHDLESKHQRPVDKKTAITFVDEITRTPKVRQLSDITDVLERLIDEDEQKELFILSDFQNNISSFDSPIDSSYAVSLIPIRALQENNVAIVSAQFESPVAMKDVTNNLIVGLSNYGNSAQDVQFSLKYQGQTRPQGIVSIPTNTTVYDTIKLTIDQTGWHEAELFVDDYPVTFDDRYHIAFSIDEEIKILNIYESRPNRYINTAFSSLNYYALDQRPVSGLRYDQFGEQDLIILDGLRNISSGLIGELEKYVSAGGNVLIFPNLNAQINDYNSLLGRLNTDRLGDINTEPQIVNNINLEDFIFNNVYETRRKNLRLPTANKYYTIQRNQSSDRETLLSFRDSKPYLTKYINESGHVYLCSSSLDEGDNTLVQNAEIFVPMLYKMAISSAFQKPLAYTIGQDEIIPYTDLSSTAQESYQMTGPEEFIPGVFKSQNKVTLDVRDQITQAGIYSLRAGDRVLGQFAFNNDRLESDVRYSDLDLIADQISANTQILDQVALADLSSYLKESREGIPLWRWCLIIALLFLLIESLLLRFWK